MHNYLSVDVQLTEVSVDYTQCAPSNSIISAANFTTCADYVICKRDCLLTENSVCSAFLNASGINASSSCQLDLPVCQCQVNITSSKRLRPDVHVYYGISNYYQNHRRYLNSRDLGQIHGDFLDSPSDDCRPLIRDNSSLPILPCGLVANSWFNGEGACIVRIIIIQCTVESESFSFVLKVST